MINIPLKRHYWSVYVASNINTQKHYTTYRKYYYCLTALWYHPSCKIENYGLLFKLIQLQPMNWYVIKYRIQDLKSTFNKSQNNKNMFVLLLLSWYVHCWKQNTPSSMSLLRYPKFFFNSFALGNHDPFIILMTTQKWH